MNLAEWASSGLIRRDHNFSGATTYKFGGPARWYADVADETELQAVIQARLEEAEHVPVFVLGRGSNVVVSDAGFPGLVIHLAGDFNAISIDGAGTVMAGGGVSLPQLARRCAAAGRGGLEFYVGIPGSVGGAVAMNAGGHGSDTAEWLIDATLIDIDTGATEVANPAGLDLAYRHSRVAETDIVVRARFRTVARDPGDGERMMREITSWRRTHQPGGTFNAGSVFKNPPGDAAGRIIDSLGLKGFRCGGVSVSDRHANFFVADAEATAQDVHDLVVQVAARVRSETGIELLPEIRFIGEFASHE